MTCLRMRGCDTIDSAMVVINWRAVFSVPWVYYHQFSGSPTSSAVQSIFGIIRVSLVPGENLVPYHMSMRPTILIIRETQQLST